MRLAPILLASLMPAAALAVGSGGSEPAPTETTETCAEGLVFDIATETCLPPEESTNEDSALLNDALRLNYEGRYAAALAVLAAVEPSSDSLTQQGYATRRAGDMEGGLALYEAALTLDPANILTRSYRGMAYVELGRMDAARDELEMIWQAGGQGSWAEEALATAIRTGAGVDY